jgi:hypothetical protein
MSGIFRKSKRTENNVRRPSSRSGFKFASPSAAALHQTANEKTDIYLPAVLFGNFPKIFIDLLGPSAEIGPAVYSATSQNSSHPNN